MPHLLICSSCLLSSLLLASITEIYTQWIWGVGRAPLFFAQCFVQHFIHSSFSPLTLSFLRPFSENTEHAPGLIQVFAFSSMPPLNQVLPFQLVNRVVGDLDLQTFVNKVISSYSGGMRRRLSVAVALVADPLIVLLDEPTSGMDVTMRRLVLSTLSRVISKHRSIIVTSHRMDECEAMCTRMSIMVNGKFKCLGSPQHLKTK